MANPPIKLIVGLGNPGREYVDTRHNAGFWFVDLLAREMGAAFNKEVKFHGEVAKAGGSGSASAVWLLKPLTFMNLSGRAVGAIAKFYQITPAEIVVAHDEMDIPAGQVKMKIGGAAGSNGIKDIASHLGTKDFWRLRIGIGHPRSLHENVVGKSGSSMERPEVVDYVLHRPSADEGRAIDEAMKRALDCWPDIAKGDMEAAMLKLHTKTETK